MVMSLIGLGVDVDGGTVVAGDNLRWKLVCDDGCVFDGVAGEILIDFYI